MWQANPLCEGTAMGDVLRLEAPISFWGGVSAADARIVQVGHPQSSAVLTGKLLVIPETIGSSSSAAVLLELLYKRIAPVGIIMGKRDAILPIGIIVARQMGWRTIPVFHLDSPPFQTGEKLLLEHGGLIRVLAAG